MMKSKYKFSFVEKPTSEFYSIRIDNGVYSGVILTYGKVSFIPQGDSMRLKFNYKLEESPKHLPKKLLESDSDFKNTIGDILSDILEYSHKKPTLNDFS